MIGLVAHLTPDNSLEISGDIVRLFKAEIAEA